MENTSLPNSLLQTITELNYAYLGILSQERKGEIADFMAVIKPGFWMIETSSFSERRKEVGNSSAIVRFICFCKEDGGGYQYFTETIEGEFLPWENCDFLCLLPYDFHDGSESKSALPQANLAWAKEAIARHGLVDLAGGARLFFEKQGVARLAAERTLPQPG